MSRVTTRSIVSAGSESAPSPQQRSISARGERSASNPASFALETNHYDTALPPMNFHQPPVVHRRTGSTLKTVMRKIFNRKRQSQTDGLEEMPNETYFSSPARSSGPIVAGTSFLAVPSPSESKRSSPLSEENLQLATHLSPTAATGGSLPSPRMGPRRRRATLPSVIFSDDESRYAVASTALSDPQEDRPVIPDQERQRSTLQARRRSRSIGELQHLASERPRSPTAWPTRTTSVPNSALESKSPHLEGGSSVSDHSGRPSTGTTVTSVTKASVAPSLPESNHYAEQMSPLPPNMGTLMHTMQQDDGLTVEQRLNTIEVKMIDLEFAIARMQSNSVNEKTQDRLSSRRKQDSFPQMRSKPSYSSSVDRDETPSPLATLASVRPVSTSTIRPDTMASRTIRPAPSATSLSDFHGISIEQYSTLVTLLRREQTARRTLEGQVASLKDDLRHFQRAALHSMELGGSMHPLHRVDSQEFLRFRRALDESDSSSPIHTTDEKLNGTLDNESDYDPFGPSKWEREREQREQGARRVVTVPMI
ncbi:uncharacterized protein N7482_003357 [Penicillium canariense]|uniref:Uncharacterized protein n=1 Tax=Penicillium canariense TaxID=189055 RepID=A0A9W9I6I1_9EURO|nr:uncharacterized protein N7482_003357 [Penicillium canariense]KAJ5167763.1 hypothetical protein N7482_003357 [Penicillium canariense]